MKGSANWRKQYRSRSTRRMIALVQVDLLYPSSSTLRFATESCMTPDGVAWEPVLLGGQVQNETNPFSKNMPFGRCTFRCADAPLSVYGNPLLSTQMSVYKVIGAKVTVWFWPYGATFPSDSLQRFVGTIQSVSMSKGSVDFMCVVDRAYNQPFVSRAVTRKEFPNAPDDSIGSPIPVCYGKGQTPGWRNAIDPNSFGIRTPNGSISAIRDLVWGVRYAGKATLVDVGGDRPFVYSSSTDIYNQFVGVAQTLGKVLVAGHAVAQTAMNYPRYGTPLLAKGRNDELDVVDTLNHTIVPFTNGASPGFVQTVFSSGKIGQSGHFLYSNMLIYRGVVGVSEVRGAQSGTNGKVLLTKHNEKLFATIDCAKGQRNLTFTLGPSNVDGVANRVLLYAVYRAIGVSGTTHRVGIRGRTEANVLAESTTSLTAATVGDAWVGLEVYSAANGSVVIGDAASLTDHQGNPCEMFVDTDSSTGRFEVCLLGVTVGYVPNRKLIEQRKTPISVAAKEADVKKNRSGYYEEVPGVYYSVEKVTDLYKWEGSFAALTHGHVDETGAVTGTAGVVIEHPVDIAHHILTTGGRTETISTDVSCVGAKQVAKSLLRTPAGAPYSIAFGVGETTGVESVLQDIAMSSACLIYKSEFDGSWRFIPWRAQPLTGERFALLGGTSGPTTSTVVSFAHPTQPAVSGLTAMPATIVAGSKVQYTKSFAYNFTVDGVSSATTPENQFLAGIILCSAGSATLLPYEISGILDPTSANAPTEPSPFIRAVPASATSYLFTLNGPDTDIPAGSYVYLEVLKRGTRVWVVGRGTLTITENTAYLTRRDNYPRLQALTSGTAVVNTGGTIPPTASVVSVARTATETSVTFSQSFPASSNHNLLLANPFSVSYTESISQHDILDPLVGVSVQPKTDTQVSSGVSVSYAVNDTTGREAYETSVYGSGSLSGNKYGNQRDNNMVVDGTIRVLKNASCVGKRIVWQASDWSQSADLYSGTVIDSGPVPVHPVYATPLFPLGTYINNTDPEVGMSFASGGPVALNGAPLAFTNLTITAYTSTNGFISIVASNAPATERMAALTPGDYNPISLAAEVSTRLSSAISSPVFCLYGGKIVAGVNTDMQFQYRVSGAQPVQSVSAALPAGEYSPEELCVVAQKALNDVYSGWSVSYDKNTAKFSVLHALGGNNANAQHVRIVWSRGWAMLGFAVNQNQTFVLPATAATGFMTVYKNRMAIVSENASIYFSLPFGTGLCGGNFINRSANELLGFLPYDRDSLLFHVADAPVGNLESVVKQVDELGLAKNPDNYNAPFVQDTDVAQDIRARYAGLMCANKAYVSFASDVLADMELGDTFKFSSDMASQQKYQSYGSSQLWDDKVFMCVETVARFGNDWTTEITAVDITA